MIGDRIRDIRGPLSQEEFAKKCGITRSSVANYETGRTIPSRFVCRMIEMACDLPAGDLKAAGPGRDAGQMLEQMKARLGARTDQELADRLGVACSSVTSWRTRGGIPRRYLKILDQIAACDGKREDMVRAELALESLQDYARRAADANTGLDPRITVALHLLQTLVGSER